ncbi:MAG: polysaccharide biosynthesis C-terminal domain-containing protein [Planctomycetota bacterium]
MDQVRESIVSNAKLNLVRNTQNTSGQEHTLFSDFVNALTGKLSHIVINILIGVATARIWGAEGRGLITMVLIWPTIIATLFELGLMRALPFMVGKRLLPLADAGKVICTLWLASSSMSAGITLLAITLILGEELTWPWLIITSLSVGIQLLANFTRGFALAIQRPRYLTRFIFIKGPISLLTILLFGWAMGLTAPTQAWIYIAAHTIGFAVAAGYGLRLIGHHSKLGLTRNVKGLFSIASNTMRFGLSGFIMHLNYHVDMFLLCLPVFMITKNDIGNYTVGVAAAGLLWQIPRSLGILLHSRGAVATNPIAFSRQVASTARGSIVLALPVMIVLFFAAPTLFPLVYGKSFGKAGAVLQILSPAILAFFGARIFEAGFNALGHTKPINLIMGATVLLNVILNILWIPRYGLYGAAYASALTYPLGTLGLGIAFAKINMMTIREVFMPRVSDLTPVTQRLQKVLRSITRATDR